MGPRNRVEGAIEEPYDQVRVGVPKARMGSVGISGSGETNRVVGSLCLWLIMTGRSCCFIPWKGWFQVIMKKILSIDHQKRGDDRTVFGNRSGNLPLEDHHGSPLTRVEQLMKQLDRRSSAPEKTKNRKLQDDRKRGQVHKNI